MLKKLIVILLLSAMALNLAACGSQVTPSGKNDLKFAIGRADEDISELLDQASKEPKKDEPQKEEGPKETGKPAPAVKDGERVKISPRAKKIAKDLNVDYNLVAGTGPGGAITEEDIRKFAEQPKTKASPTAAVVAGQLGLISTILKKIPG
jgi:pyruvate dehydrogenase E2 component (dihydrolipoamide acetyltransferase)